MVRPTQTIRRLLPMNCLSVFDHFVGLVLKGLRLSRGITLFLSSMFYYLSKLAVGEYWPCLNQVISLFVELLKQTEYHSTYADPVMTFH